MEHIQQTHFYINVIKYSPLTQTCAEVLRYLAHFWGQIPQSIASPWESAVQMFKIKKKT